MSSSPSSSSSSDQSDGLRPDRTTQSEAVSFAHMRDVRFPVSVVLGSGTITVRECLALGARHLVRLNQPAGEDVQVIVGDVPIARAEVVIVEDSTGVRVTEMLEPTPTEDR